MGVLHGPLRLPPTHCPSWRPVLLPPWRTLPEHREPRPHSFIETIPRCASRRPHVRLALVWPFRATGLGFQSSRGWVPFRAGHRRGVQPHKQPENDRPSPPIDDGGISFCIKGYFSTHDKNVTTIFSAPNYCYMCGNLAAVMEVDEALNQTYIQYDPAPRKGNAKRGRVPDYFLWFLKNIQLVFLGLHIQSQSSCSKIKK